jgi:hypothetical protein
MKIDPPAASIGWRLSMLLIETGVKYAEPFSTQRHSYSFP